MEEQQRQQIKKYLGIVLRRKKLIVSCFLLSIVAGLAVYVKTPKIYQSTALIIYQRARVNPTNMSPDVSAQTREMVNTLTQQVTSRSSLEDLVKQFDLYRLMREKMPMEDVVDNMREHIEIQNTRGDVFTVSFNGSDPKKVMLVTNAVASRFIEENLRFREEKATETSNYVKDELAMAKETLDKKEEIMRDYKLKFYNEMPHQLQANMTRLNALQQQYQSNQEGMRDLERTKVLIQEQINNRNEMIAQTEMMARQGMINARIVQNAQQVSPAEAEMMQDRRELQNLKDTLDGLLLRYTNAHPEVKRLSKQIELLQTEIENKDKSKKAVSNDSSPAEEQGESGEEVDIQSLDPQLQQLELQLKELNYNLAQMKMAEKEIEKQIDQYQKWIAATPVREAEWAALTRDYEQMHNHYQELVRRNIEAESAQNLERRQKGSQFKIVDSAHFPEKPFRPDFKKIMLLALALGLGIGGGIAFLLDFTDDSFKDVNELESNIGISIICSIPLILTLREKKMQKVKNVAWGVVFILAGGGILGGFIVLWKKGLIII